MTSRSLARRATLPVVTVLVLAGCGGGEDSDGTPRGDLAAAMADAIQVIGGLDADTACIEAEAESLTDAEVEQLTDAYDNEEVVPTELEDWATATSDKCVSIGE